MSKKHMTARSDRKKYRLNREKLTDQGNKMLSDFVKLAKKNKNYPNQAILTDYGHTRERLREHFGNLTGLQEYAKIHDPELVNFITEEKIKDPKKTKDLPNLVKKTKRFLVTSASNSSPVDVRFLKSLKNYCNVKNAVLLIVPSGYRADDMDALLSDEQWVFDKTDLNSNIYVSAIKIPPKSINPLTGLARIGQRNGSTIVGSPKQHLEFVATGDNTLPHALMSTGSVTKPEYRHKDGSYRKNDLVALHDHVMGAIVVEIEDNKNFHFRQIQADKNGAFVDINQQFSGNKVRKYNPSHFVIGDYHVTETDPTAAKAWDEVSKETGQPIRIHHDFFSGVSVNHHEEDNLISRAMLAEKGQLSLEDELRAVAKALNEETDKASMVIVVASNHHDFLTKHYLQKSKYINEPHNFRIAHKMALAMLDGSDPLQHAMEKIIGIKHPEKVRWLKRDESYKVAGIELGSHGDKGGNGSKGSALTLEKAYGNCVVGHSHTPKILRGFWQCGTTSYLRLPYTEGSSSWCHTSTLVFPNGTRQHINSFNGRWRLK